MIDVHPAPISRWSAHYSNVYSQYGEDGLLAEIFRLIGTTNKQCFEVGAADGKWFSNSRRLIDDGWSAALIEADPANWPELDKLDAPPRVNVVHGKVEPSGKNCLDSILNKCGFDPDMDLGVIDVDGQEWYLWNGMLRFRPRVMVVEYDRFADPAFVPDLNGPGQAGLAAICSIAVTKGYFSAATTPTNMIFIRNDLSERFHANMPRIRERIEPGIPETAADEEEDRLANARDRAEREALSQEFHRLATNAGEAIKASTPMLATGREQEIKIAAILSRPRFGLNCFWDFASEALAPWHIPLQSFYGVFYGQCMARSFENNIDAGVDWIITLDYDSAFCAKHVQLLIDALAENPKIDAIAALQVRRGRPLPLAVRADGQMKATGDPVQVRTAHFGLTILRVDAIKKVKKPWFWAQPAPDGGWGEGRLDDDIAWWAKWGDAGNSLYVHTGCRIGHVEEMVSDYDGEFKPRHSYLSAWRKENGHQVESFE